MRIRMYNQGLSAIEMIIYVAILSVLTTTVAYSIISMMTSYRELRIVKHIERSGILAMERMTREIREATSIDTGQSTLGSSPGVLQLNAGQGGSSRVVKFFVEDGALKVSENDVTQGPLTAERATVTSLIFRQIITSNSDAVRIEMAVEASTTGFSRSYNFYDTIILRGSY